MKPGALRGLTVDQLITDVKLAGAAGEIFGLTTPEGWPFVIIVAIAKPGNERAVELTKDFADKMAGIAEWPSVTKVEPDA